MDIHFISWRIIGSSLCSINIGHVIVALVDRYYHDPTGLLVVFQASKLPRNGTSIIDAIANVANLRHVEIDKSLSSSEELHLIRLEGFWRA